MAKISQKELKVSAKMIIIILLIITTIALEKAH
jgi:hypothetical protein